jgi:drug/metabolite transporter (DMT)-like permease
VQADGKRNWKTPAMVSVVVATNVLGNFSMGWGVKHELIPRGILGPILILFNPWVALGVILLILWMLSRMALLSWADLSYVLPVTSFGYVLNALLGRFLLGEQVSPQRWAGTLLIVAGTTLVGLGSHATPARVES